MIQNTSGKFHTVQGFMSEPERIALQRCVLNTAHISGNVLEIGSLNGLSALLILCVMGSGKELCCIDYNQVDNLRANISMWQFMIGAHRVQIIHQDFHKVDFEGEKFSFVFIDHSHTYQDNIDAFEQLWPHISSGGIVAFHDYEDLNWVEGTRAINELVVRYQLCSCDKAGSFIAFRKP